MLKHLLMLAAAIGGMLLTGCSRIAGKVSTDVDGVDLSLSSDGKGGISVSAENAVGGVELSGHLGDPAATQPASTQPIR